MLKEIVHNGDCNIRRPCLILLWEYGNQGMVFPALNMIEVFLFLFIVWSTVVLGIQAAG